MSGDAMAAMQENQVLQDFNPTREKVKFTLGKMLKWAAVGALVGGVGMAAASGLMTTAIGGFGAMSAVGLITAGLGSAAVVPVVGWVIGGMMAAAGIGIAIASYIGLTGAALGAAAVTGLMWGAGIGAAIGAIRGISGAQDAVDEKRDDLEMDIRKRMEYADLTRQMQAKRTQQWIEVQKQAAALGVSPNLGLPIGMGMEGRMV
ncbi:MAG: hypothetical protein KGI29_04625 [Pseudomonadota bacterium]|nr:hypothetical protein [Pseudomonadota bacterium]MDE3037081.1 hypothetical protein [Pseudomonadota bacterium]